MRNRMQHFLAPPEPNAVLARADGWAEMIRDPTGAHRAVVELVGAVAGVFASCDSREWSLFRSAFAAHPISALLRRDPMLERSLGRGTRGLAPDPVLGDLMLRHPSAEPIVRRADEIGRNLYAATCALPACEATRERNRLIARLADSLAERRWGAEILCIAPGFMREAEGSLSGAGGGLRRWVGLVQEAERAAEIRRSMPVPWVVPIEGNTMANLLRGDLLGSFDLVYFKPLELIDDEAAAALAVAAFARVRPGGRLLLCCRASLSDDIAFWSLGPGVAFHGRDEAGLARLVTALPAAEIASSAVFSGVNEAMLFLEVTRR
jgi:hypothetical protein